MWFSLAGWTVRITSLTLLYGVQIGLLLAGQFPSPTLCVSCLPFLALLFRVDWKLRKESLTITNMVAIRNLYEKVGFPVLITSL